MSRELFIFKHCDGCTLSLRDSDIDREVVFEADDSYHGEYDVYQVNYKLLEAANNKLDKELEAYE